MTATQDVHPPLMRTAGNGLRIVSPRRPAPTDADILRRTGLHLPHQIPYDKWLGIGRHLATTVSSSAWCLGDWLIYGEISFTGRYRKAIEQTSLEYKTLRNYAWVARRFTLPRRRGTLSFGHHAEVAALSEPEQEFWLRKAEVLGWSRNDIRREVHTSLRERRGQEPAGARGRYEEPAEQYPGLPGQAGLIEPLKVEVTAEQLEVISQAAGSARLTVSAWAALALEQAALSTLGSALVSRRRDGSDSPGA
jgi:hypothetical protein